MSAITGSRSNQPGGSRSRAQQSAARRSETSGCRDAAIAMRVAGAAVNATNVGEPRCPQLFSATTPECRANPRRQSNDKRPARRSRCPRRPSPNQLPSASRHKRPSGSSINARLAFHVHRNASAGVVQCRPARHRRRHQRTESGTGIGRSSSAVLVFVLSGTERRLVRGCGCTVTRRRRCRVCEPGQDASPAGHGRGAAKIVWSRR